MTKNLKASLEYALLYLIILTILTTIVFSIKGSFPTIETISVMLGIGLGATFAFSTGIICQSMREEDD